MAPQRQDTQPRFYAQPASNVPSTASLIPPSARSPNQGAVQAAFARAPQSLRSVPSLNSLNDSPYSGAAAGRTTAGYQVNSISDKFSLAPDPRTWGADLSPNHAEPDDYLHNPDPRRDRKHDRGGHVLTYRGLTNLGCLFVLTAGLLTLFAGYPMISYFTRHDISLNDGFNLGGINASGQLPSMTNDWGLIDVDTPSSAYTVTSFADGSEWQLVFSDEFNVDGRTFWPGDDPYWEAANLHYWQTNDLEWYYPDTVTTKGGYLTITMSERTMNNLNYTSGLISSWNKFCFTGGMVLVSPPSLMADPSNGDVLVVPTRISGLSRCTCPGQSHPGPVHSDGTYVGRSAPEIDIFEAQISGEPLTGQVSQSAQWAYQSCYTGISGCFQTYGYEYQPGYQSDGGYITWITNDQVTWTIDASGMAADSRVNISDRPVPQEPMYLIMNLAISPNFATIDFTNLVFPAVMQVDWIRVYQPKSAINIGCDPKDFPTAAYINEYIEAYSNPNLTTWNGDYGQPFPKNSLLTQC
ncbi:glycoside hydrolase family 16 protein [Pisolithus croceorrhizus]|nr:glycoside hydrolase family 16 protein [Pisolithus croceorrhizus]